MKRTSFQKFMTLLFYHDFILSSSRETFRFLLSEAHDLIILRIHQLHPLLVGQTLSFELSLTSCGWLWRTHQQLMRESSKWRVWPTSNRCSWWILKMIKSWASERRKQGLITAAQEQTFPTNTTTRSIYMTAETHRYKLGEIVRHVVSRFSKHATKEYKIPQWVHWGVSW